MSAPFDRPDSGGGDQFVNADHVGALLVIQPKEAVRGMETKSGPSDVIVADIFLIGPANGGSVLETFQDAYLFGKVLQGQLKRKIGRTVLGVLDGQPGVKIGGQNVPYTLKDPSPAQEQAAIRAMSSRPDPAVQEPPAPRQAPAQDVWGAQSAPGSQQQVAPGGWGQQPAAAAPAAPWETTEPPF